MEPQVLVIPILRFRPNKDSIKSISGLHCTTCPVVAFCRHQAVEAEANLRFILSRNPDAEFFEIEGDVEKMKYAVENCPLRKLLR